VPKKYAILLSSLLAFGLLFFLFQRIDLEEFQRQIQKFWDAGQLPWLLAWSIVYVALQGLRFFIIFPTRANVWQHIGLNFCNHTMNILLPGRAGEAVRPTYLKRWWSHINLKELIGWTVFEKISEFTSMLIFVIFGALIYYAPLLKLEGHIAPNASLWGIVFIGVSMLLCLRRLKTKDYFKKPNLRPDTGTLKKGEKFFWAVLISTCTWIANSLGILAVTGDPKVAFALLVSMTLAGAIPMLPAGLGAAQWAAVALAGIINLAESEALAYSSAIHLVWILSRLLIGVPIIFLAWGWPESKETGDKRINAAAQ